MADFSFLDDLRIDKDMKDERVNTKTSLDTYRTNLVKHITAVKNGKNKKGGFIESAKGTYFKFFVGSSSLFDTEFAIAKRTLTQAEKNKRCDEFIARVNKGQFDDALRKLALKRQKALKKKK